LTSDFSHQLQTTFPAQSKLLRLENKLWPISYFPSLSLSIKLMVRLFLKFGVAREITNITVSAIINNK